MENLARPVCCAKTRLPAWLGKGVAGNGEFTAAVPAKYMARMYIKACLFVFLFIASDILVLHPSEKTLPRSLSTNENPYFIAIHQ